jgi:hypothetical protein
MIFAIFDTAIRDAVETDARYYDDDVKANTKFLDELEGTTLLIHVLC